MLAITNASLISIIVEKRRLIAEIMRLLNRVLTGVVMRYYDQMQSGGAFVYQGRTLDIARVVFALYCKNCRFNPLTELLQTSEALPCHREQVAQAVLSELEHQALSDTAAPSQYKATQHTP